MTESALVDDHSVPSPSPRRILVLFLAVVAMTLPAACYSGIVLLRWGDPPDLQNYVNVLHHIPDQIGTWRFVADGDPVREAVVEKLELSGYVHRVYEQAGTGQRAALLLLVGPAGPLVRHPPEICYETAANELLRTREIVIHADGREHRMRMLAYASNSLLEGGFLVAYGFGDQLHWDIPDSPRRAYGGKPVLFKLQVLTESPDETSGNSSDGLQDFLTQLLPALNAAAADQLRQPRPE